MSDQYRAGRDPNSPFEADGYFGAGGSHRPVRRSLEDTFDDILRTAHRTNLNLGLLAGCVEGALSMRGTISDAACLDMIAVALKRSQACSQPTTLPRDGRGK
jgi:hypothetical protein